MKIVKINSKTFRYNSEISNVKICNNVIWFNRNVKALINDLQKPTKNSLGMTFTFKRPYVIFSVLGISGDRFQLVITNKSKIEEFIARTKLEMFGDILLKLKEVSEDVTQEKVNVFNEWVKHYDINSKKIN